MEISSQLNSPFLVNFSIEKKCTEGPVTVLLQALKALVRKWPRSIYFAHEGLLTQKILISFLV